MKTRMRWSALVLLGSLVSSVLAGCYAFDGQAKDGQSHWMTTCETSGDCAGGRICACGVCTVECTESAACGSQGTCEAVDERAACEGSPALVERVCLERCAQDSTCEASELVCEDRACVPRVPKDAGIARDASLDGRIDSSLGEQEGGTAGTGDTSTPPPGEEPALQPEDAGKVDDGATQEPPPGIVHACNDPPYEACVETGASCGFCEVGCNGELCMPSMRPACAAGGACPNGLICHIDYTCIERGVSDENGIATLAIGPLEGHNNFIATTLVDFVVTGDTLYWLDVGNHNSAPGYDPSRNGGIYRVDLVSGAEATIASDLDVGRYDLSVQDGYAFYADAAALHYLALDGSAMGSVAAPQLSVQWLIEDGVIFYGESDGSVLRRHDPTTGEDRVLIDLGEQHRIKKVASDGARIFIEEALGTELPRLISVDEAGGPLEVVAPVFESGADRMSAVLYDGAGRFVLDDADNGSLLRYAPGDAEPTVLVTTETTAVLGSLFQGYAYYALIWSGPTPRPTVMRVPIDGGTPEVLRRSNRSSGLRVLARDGFIYWIEDRRVLRMPIP